MRRRTAHGALALALLSSGGLAGCSDDAPQPAVPSPSTASPASGTATPATEEPVEQATNPCDFIDRAEYVEGLTRREKRYVVATPVLTSDAEPRYMCDVRYTDYALLSFGYALDDEIYPTVRRTINRFGTIEDIDGIGDEAFIEDSTYLATAAAQVGERTVVVQSGIYELEPGALREALGDLVEAVEDQPIVNGPAIDLGEGCPRVDSPAVRAVVPEVVLARGGIDDEGVPECQYRSSDKQSVFLSMGASEYTPERFENDEGGGVFGDIVDVDVLVVDPPPGRTERVYGDPRDGFAVLTSYPSVFMKASVSTSKIGIREGRPSSRPAVQRLARRWFATAEPLILADRPGRG